MNVLHYKPKKLPVNLDYGIFARELADAQYALGLLEGLQRKLHNPLLLISPLSAKEAAVSSRIEGTQSTASDVFLYEAGGKPRYSDTAEVVNYRQAMTFAISKVKERRKITPHFLKELHKILLQGVRHKGEMGDFRKGPVWIAEKHGDPIEKATYIPPEYFVVPEYIENLFDYINKDDENLLVRAGIVHYQFEAIHPFEDGNGRIGRLLIPLLLFYKQQLSLPIIYLSGYFDEHRDEYINSLHAVDKGEKYELWLKFFLRVFTKQATETQQLIEKIYKLYDDNRDKLQGLKSPYIIPLLDFIFRHPIFTISMAIRSIKSSWLTCNRLVKLLEQQGVVIEIKTRMGRSKLYAFNSLLSILR